MNTAHTLGPWRIDRRDRDEWEIVGKRENATRFGKKGEWTVCDIDAGDLPKPEATANARLIAAAPDLLAALLAAEKLWSTREAELGMLSKELTTVREVARAALAKVTAV